MDIAVIRSNRKTVAIQVNADLTVTVRVPQRTSRKDIERIIREKEPWIRKHIEQIRAKREAYEAMETSHLTDEEIRELADKARKYIPERVAYFAEHMGVTYGRITIRNQKTRSMNVLNRKMDIGVFDSEEEAHTGFIDGKIDYICDLAEKCKGKVPDYVYEGMLNYKIEID